jgi:general secretion pathway protein L
MPKEKVAQRLLVFVPPSRVLAKQTLASSTVVSYVAWGGTAGPQAGEAPVALLPKAAMVDAVFDTADVFVAAIDAPKLSEAKLRQALPNLLEDRLLTDPADCQFAFDLPRQSGTTTIAQQPKLAVSVIDRGLLTRALDALGAAGYRLRAGYCEIYTVPAPAAAVLSVRADRGRGIARSGKHDGFAFDLDASEPPAALLLAVRQLGIKRLQAYGREAAIVAGHAAALGVTVDVMNREVDESAVDGAVNLLQGTFAQGGMLSRAGLPKISAGSLRAPLIWTGVAAAVLIGGMNAYWLKLESESRALRSGMETSFRSAFPEATAVVDPVLQTKRQLGGLRSRAGIPSADDFSVLNTQAAQLFSVAPVGAIAGVEYRDGSLRVKMKPGNTLDAGMQNALRAQAIQQGLTLRFDADGSARLSPAGQ